mmetsp:Transcript_21465/g.36628  ORF Transcript_21465/g.36628 Transcript_21465/m.36628 type:complete len:211 (-) Transcript_21465:364-996(-)|eukprot:CAMPEP_0119104904 /NCGR_PEP_ID=MMETSP1180-20130426/2995_1 /TAXON_ID=3052 ORGANISM="Chlamydomonas cf sp, Strain CCMP681" /NCGR_SAMPLE_ID=MMETSP1180 /ASSEMBLY_ACC=CAM_ASM_000741 /LENGTH=210 /DNA_ID=CAMNT_0007089783 /DNA_START=96 /DNA_END=728 /DNA_ORIENTATION=-
MELRSGTVVRNPLPPAGRAAFEEGAQLMFLKWTALCLAVDGQWGGAGSADKANWLLQQSIDWFYRAKDPYWDELEEELLDALLQDFNLELEDGSAGEMAKSLMSLFQECGKADYSTVLRLRAQAAAHQASGAAASRRQVVDNDGTVMGEEDEDDSSSDDDSDEGEEGDEDAAMDEGTAPAALPLRPEPPAPVVDADGFTLVQKPKRAGRK